jgi:hypothetical protein
MSAQLKSAYAIGAANKKGYAYAFAFGPFDGFESLKSLHPAYIQRRRLNWQVSPLECSGLLIDDYGERWPDVLACSTAPPSCFFSERAIESLARNGIAPEQIIPVPVGSILGSKLLDIPRPNYYVIVPRIGIAVDYVASGIQLDQAGNPQLPVGQNPPVQLDPDTWSGDDLFRCSNWPRGGKEFLCTEEMKRIVESEGWTNVEFVRQGIKGISLLPRMG